MHIFAHNIHLRVRIIVRAPVSAKLKRLLRRHAIKLAEN